jgi:restriction endonuclease S subunit
MAICYITNISSLDEDKVLDSRFYDPQKIEFINLLSNKNQQKACDEFEEITDLVTSANHEFFPAMVYDLPHSLGNIFVDGKIIPSSAELGSTKKIGLAGDLAVSRLRYYLKEFAIVPNKEISKLLSTEYVILRSRGQLSTSLLLPFLLTDEVQYIFECSQRGSNHPRLANKDILRLPFPQELRKLDKVIAEMIKDILVRFERSSKLYPEAEQELLERLEFRKINISHVLDYSVSSRNIFKDERLDPEFYQPKFEHLIKRLKKVGAKKLNEFCPLPNRGVQPAYADQGNIIVVNSKHLGPTEIDIENSEHTSESFYEEDNTAKAKLQRYDVLMYSTGAYVGRTNVYLENLKGIASNHVTIIRPDSKVCNPVYLALFLNSPAGLMQTDQRASGSAQREIYPQNITEYQIFIPQNKDGKPDLTWQNKLADKVIQANQAKKQAKQKLQEAKELVEKEISRMIKK